MQGVVDNLLTTEKVSGQWSRIGSIAGLWSASSDIACSRCFWKKARSPIENPNVIKKILKHLNLWDLKRPPRPVASVVARWGSSMGIVLCLAVEW